MTVTYWTGFTKRKNSTKTPSSGTTITGVYLKDDTTVLNPGLELTGVPATANYFYISDFGRYYFVRNVTKVGADRNYFELEVDVMASYKSYVAGYTGLVEYTSSSSDVTITDPRNKPTSLISASSGALALASNIFNSSGSYILGVLSDNANGTTGVISYYAMTAADMQLFTLELYDQTFLQRLVDQFTAAQDSLVSCIWVPIATANIPGTANMKIHIGREIMNSEGKKIATRHLSMTTGAQSLSFPSGSGAGGDMVYIDKAPYTTGTMYLPFVGVVPLDVDIAAFTKNIQLDADIDLFTGDIVYRVRHGGAVVSTYNGNIATKMPISSAGYDGVGVATGALAAIGGLIAAGTAIATGGATSAIAGGLATAAGGGIAAARSMELHTMINGSTSSALGAHLGLDPWYAIYTYVPASGAALADLLADQAENGMPYFKVANISALSGFVKCAAASVEIAGTPEEKDTLNGYMNGGFYYE